MRTQLSARSRQPCLPKCPADNSFCVCREEVQKRRASPQGDKGLKSKCPQGKGSSLNCQAEEGRGSPSVDSDSLGPHGLYVARLLSHGQRILWARILERVVMSFSKGSS